MATLNDKTLNHELVFKLTIEQKIKNKENNHFKMSKKTIILCSNIFVTAGMNKT